MNTPLGSKMRADLDETPAVLATLLLNLVKDKRPESWLARASKGIAFVARGSSAHMTQLAAAALAVDGPSLPCVLPPSTLTSSDSGKTDLTNCLVFAVSQSGETPEITNAALAARKQGALVVAITNSPNSPLAAAADEIVELHAGQERAVPATKTVNAQAAALLFLMGKLVSDSQSKPPTDAQWQKAPSAIEELVSEQGWQSAQRIIGQGGTPRAVLGRGLTTPIAREGALKMTETAGELVAGGSGYEFLHGWVAGTKSGDRILTLAATPHDARDLDRVSSELTKRSISTLAIEVDATGPLGAHPWLRAMALLIRVQQIAWLNTLSQGLNPDQAFGLSKVTPTK